MGVYSLAAMLVVGVAAISPHQASAASVPASPADAAAVAMVFEHDPTCSVVTVSTHDGNWARWEPVVLPPCSAEGLAEFDMAMRVDGIWARVITFFPGVLCVTAGIPDAVGRDLRVCEPLTEAVYLPWWGTFRQEPRRLLYDARGALVRLRWRGWGRWRAQARGTLEHSSRWVYGDVRAPVRVVADRRRNCDARRSYRRLTVTFVRRKDRKRYPALGGVFPIDCPENDE